MLALFRISSTPMSTLMALRRVSTVNSPNENKIAPIIRYEESALGENMLFLDFLTGENYGSNHGDEQYERGGLEREKVILQEKVADYSGRCRVGDFFGFHPGSLLNGLKQ